jgi:hypothetical protein
MAVAFGTMPLSLLESTLPLFLFILAREGRRFLTKRHLALFKRPLSEHNPVLSVMLGVSMFVCGAPLLIKFFLPVLPVGPMIHSYLDKLNDLHEVPVFRWLYWCLTIPICAATLVLARRYWIQHEQSAWEMHRPAVPVSDKVSGDELRVLRPSRLRHLGFAALFATPTVYAIWITANGDRIDWITWLVVFASVPFISLALAMLLFHNRLGLEIGPNGFTLRYLFRARAFRWADVDTFFVTSLGRNKMVVFNYSPEYRGPKVVRQKVSPYLAWALPDRFEGALPELYGMSAESLADLMNHYKLRNCGGQD